MKPTLEQALQKELRLIGLAIQEADRYYTVILKPILSILMLIIIWVYWLLALVRLMRHCCF